MFDTEELISLKVIDFGTAKICEPEISLSDKAGTVLYIAPEVLQKNYNNKCDIWSLGVILYILLTGRAPFQGKSDDETLKLINSGLYNKKHPLLN